ncbi:sulfotransferase family 2 domain-containing protein [Aliiglaciecola sp. NS0011-25]|uniref:sulfotransferase family 2 domain-containing protein n=1 Tax=Aliiglaciecola sp. NS0011-25 TaxID=3127654 RepID=UPI0031068E7D
MLVSHLKKFIFVKSVKTASTSVEVYFERYCVADTNWQPQHHREQLVTDAGIIGYRGPNRGESEYYNHMSAKTIRDKLAPNIWDDYFKFTIVRNPFDKVISAFYHFEKSRNPEKYQNQSENDVSLFRNWVKSGGKVLDKQIYLLDNQDSLDFYIRYESLLDGIQHVCERINVPFQPEQLPNFKSQFRNRNLAIEDFYDQPTRDLIAKHYEFEIEKFGYTV